MIRIRSFGSYSIQVSDSLLFVNKVVGTRGVFSNNDITDYLRSIVVSKLTAPNLSKFPGAKINTRPPTKNKT